MMAQTVNRRTASFSGDAPALVSVIVPVYNDPDGIRDTLESLLEQTYPEPAHEILAVDNGSTDGTRAVIREYAETDSRVSLVVEDEVQGSYAARNAGIEASSGSVLAFVDADVTVDSDWLERAVGKMDAENAAYLACDVSLHAPGEETLIGKYNRMSGFPVRSYLDRHEYAPTCCLFVTRAVFDDVGLFDSRFVSGGDMEFGNRVADSGRDLHFAPDVAAYHPVRSSLRALVQKELRVGRGRCQQQQYYPDRYGRPGVPPRPSGVKSATESDTTLTATERAYFSVLPYALTGVRGVGYLLELVGGTIERIRGSKLR